MIEIEQQAPPAPASPPAVPQAEAHDQRPTSSNHKWWVLVAMMFGLFMPMLDNLVVNVALPTIQLRLGAGISGLQWIVDAYTLAFASFMLTGGALGDLFGRKRFFMAGLGLFTAGSLLCGLSATTGQLIAFRAVQGLGAAMLLPGSLSIITATFSGKERGAAIGIWASVSGLAIAIGPVVGGLLVEHVSWQSIFYVNVPVGILGILMAALIVRESRDTSRSRRLDLPGLATGTAGLFFLVYALIEGNGRGWTDGLILGSFALAAAFLALFLVVESRRTSPMLPLSFFRIPTFAAANAVAATIFFALFGSVFFLSLYLQNVLGYSPVAAGLRLLAFSGVILFVAPVAGRLSDRYGSRGFMTIGPLLAAAGMSFLLLTGVHSSYVTVLLPGFVILAAGLSLTLSPMTAAVMGSVPTAKAGVASAATNTSREIGGVFGVALLGAIITSSFRAGFAGRLLQAGMGTQQAQLVVAHAGARAAAGSTRAIGNAVVADAVKASYVHAMHTGALVAVGFMVVASVISAIFVRNHVTKDA